MKLYIIILALLITSNSFASSKKESKAPVFTTSPSVQILYLNDGVIGIRQDTTIKFYVTNGDLSFSYLEGKDFVIPFETDEIFYMSQYEANPKLDKTLKSDGVLGVRKDKTIKFYNNKKLAFSYMKGKDFLIPIEFDEIIYLADWIFGIRKSNTLRFYTCRDLVFSYLKEKDFVIPSEIDKITHLTENVTGVRHGKVVKFYISRRLVFSYISGKDFVIPNDFDEIFYLTEWLVGVRKATNVKFYVSKGDLSFSYIEGKDFNF